MAAITFLKNKNFALAADSVVFEPEEMNALNGILDQAGQVHELINNEKSTIEQATEEGYNDGYEKGQSAGYEAALEHIAVKLVTLAKEANSARAELKDTAGDIALQIVEKIATDLGSQETVRSLALSAASELAPFEPIVLRVNPVNVEYLKEHLLNPHDEKLRFIEIATDTALEEQDCVLETEHGHIKAGLQVQLNVMRSQFYGS